MFIVVLDTNIIVSGLLKGSCRLILNALIERRFCLAISEPLINEIIEVCLRPKFSRRIDKNDIESLMVIIKESAKLVKPKIRINDCRDKDDNIVLECAVTSKAQTIVTGDSDLLVLHPYRKSISIITPEIFLELLNKNDPSNGNFLKIY